MNKSINTFNCPACGAPLEPQIEQNVVKCPYCNSSIITPGSTSSAVSTGSFHSAIDKIIRSIQEGNKIKAINIFREITNCNLKDAKDVIDAIERGEAIDVTRYLDVEPMGGRSLGNLETEGRIPPPKPSVEKLSESTAQFDRYTHPKKSGGNWFWIIFVVFLFTVIILPIYFGLLPDLRSTLNTRSTQHSEQANTLVSPSTIPFAIPVIAFGEEGIGPGMLSDIRSIGVDSQGRIYTGSFQDGRIQIYDEGGNFLRLINVGEETPIIALAVALDGSFYTLFNGEIHHYDSDWQEEAEINLQSPNKYSSFIENIALGADGNRYVVYYDMIVRYGENGKPTLIISDAFDAVTGHSELDIHIALDGLGNIYALGTFNNLVLKYSPEGQFLDRFGGESEHPAQGIDPGRFQAPYAIAVDGYGRIFVSDVWGIQVFNSDGQFTNFFKVEGSTFGMTFDLNNNLYIASNTPRIIKLQVQRP